MHAINRENHAMYRKKRGSHTLFHSLMYESPPCDVLSLVHYIFAFWSIQCMQWIVWCVYYESLNHTYTARIVYVIAFFLGWARSSLSVHLTNYTYLYVLFFHMQTSATVQPRTGPSESLQKTPVRKKVSANIGFFHGDGLEIFHLKKNTDTEKRRRVNSKSIKVFNLIQSARNSQKRSKAAAWKRCYLEKVDIEKTKRREDRTEKRTGFGKILKHILSGNGSGNDNHTSGPLLILWKKYLWIEKNVSSARVLLNR